MVFAAMQAGCGYYFVGRGSVPYKEVRSICIGTFRNTTAEAGIENIFTKAAIAEFARGKWLQIDCSNPDVELQGKIKDYRIIPAFFTNEDNITGYQVSVVMEVFLVRKSTGDVLWKDTALSGTDSSTASEEILTAKSNEMDTVSRIAKTLMESLYNRLSQNF